MRLLVALILILAGVVLLALPPQAPASRYWVGGTATWDGSTTANWSATSGGAPGASVPTSSDNCFLDAASGAVTVTLSAASACRDFDGSAFTGTVSHPAATTLTIGGSFKLGAGMTYTLGNVATSAISLTSTATGNTFTSAGKHVGNVTLSGVGGEWFVLDNLLMDATATFNPVNGTLHMDGLTDNAGLAHNIGTFNSVNQNTRTFAFGAMTMSLTGTGSSWFADCVGLTMQPNTSVVTIVAANNRTPDMCNVNGASGFSWQGMSIVIDMSTGVNNTDVSWFCDGTTFRNVTIIGPAQLYSRVTVEAGGFTATGTSSINGNSAVNRLWLQGFNNISRTITYSGTPSINNVDITSIAFSAPLNLSSGIVGDCKGNSNLTATASDTEQWNNAAGGSWTTLANWTGTGSPARVPLCQDAVVINVAFGASKTVTANAMMLGGSIDWSGSTFTTALTWSIASSSRFQTMMAGGLTLISGLTVSGSGAGGTLTFISQNTITVTSNGATFGSPFNAHAGGVSLGDNFTCTSASNGGLTIDTGGDFHSLFDGNGHTVTAAIVGSGGIVTLGGGAWALTGTGTVWSATGGSTVNPGTSAISITDTSSSTKTFAGGGKTYFDISITGGGTGAVVVSGSNTFHTFTVGAPKTLTFTAGTTQTFTTFTLNSSAGNVITIQSSSAGSKGNLSITSGVLRYDYLAIKDSNAAGGASWYAGSNSTNNGGTAGWIWPGTSAISGAIRLSGNTLLH